MEEECVGVCSFMGDDDYDVEEEEGYKRRRCIDL